MSDSFADTTLVLLGHGSTQNDDSAPPVRQHVAAIRAQRIFGDVREAFWKQEPQISSVLEGIRSPRAIIVPFFISEGYFCEQAIPEALGFKRPGEDNWSRNIVQANQSITYTPPVGTHPRMTEVLLHRAREVVEEHPFPRKPRPTDTSLFVAGHGTKRNSQSRISIERQVAAIREQNLFAEVHPCFMEEEPAIADVSKTASRKNVVVIPFFISDGLHVAEDIPVLLGEPEAIVKKRLTAGQPTWRNPTERDGKLIWYASAVGSDPGMSVVIVELARSAISAI